jgi:hypothetical protein
MDRSRAVFNKSGGEHGQETHAQRRQKGRQGLLIWPQHLARAGGMGRVLGLALGRAGVAMQRAPASMALGNTAEAVPRA